ncbi:type I secretion protein ATPase [Pseudorhodobacter sp. W20_MBD10_FR17]|uniref:type I secretion protein ATPase n=1 Tax=Pseudorhodobacter sp. W20_MBD10_FR17 TaxID=3240266 RepID=UPI003F99A876
MLDKVTEMVAHMIGIFHTTLEDGRMRDSYLTTHALRQSDPETGPLLSAADAFKAPYQLEDFKPRIRYDDVPRDLPKMGFEPPFPGNPDSLHWAGLLPVEPLFHTPTAPIFAKEFVRPKLTLEPPGSVVTVTLQTAYLADNDLLRLNDSGTVFVDPAVFESQLQGYHAVAQAISAPIGTALPDLGVSAHGHALALHNDIGTLNAPDFSGATITILHGTDAIGSFSNGKAVEVEAPLQDVMPAYLAKYDVTDQPAADAAPDWVPDPFDGLNTPYASGENFTPSEGHELVTGANTLINQTNISFGWLDAPVIAVMGDVISLNIISQTNMLIEHAQLGGAGYASTSASYNSAFISLQSSASPIEAGGDTEANLTLPWNWAVTRIDGDLLTVNHVQQYSFVTDLDRADVGFYSASSYIDMGQNQVINLTSLLEIGYGYDLIIIGGNMITINQISQMNVLIDNALVSYDGLLPTAFSAGDNLLYNGAAISVTGIDSYQSMQSNFETAANGLAAGDTDIGASAARDPVFEGIDILRVLYISGDATTINMVNQTNVLGDSDQVHLALDNFQSATGADISVTTGSNALINLASISQLGVDSQVSVGGEVYSDALLYQAGFLDTDANPLGVALPALTNEAVAFLADDMVGPDAPDDMGIVPTTIDATSTPDVMQSMLA